jgi:hypothetical protein
MDYAKLKSDLIKIFKGTSCILTCEYEHLADAVIEAVISQEDREPANVPSGL